MATFEVHRNILATRCSYFRAAFANPTDDGKARKTDFLDSSKATVAMLLLYIYCAQLPKEIEVKKCHSFSGSMLSSFALKNLRNIVTMLLCLFDCLGSARLDQFVGTVRKISC